MVTDRDGAQKRGAMLAIVDYGLGNVGSLMNAIAEIGAEPTLVEDADALLACDRIILPGVGAIEKAIETLKARNLDAALIERAKAGVPMLGVCLGMQLLCTRSFEGGEYAALNLIEADVVSFDRSAGLKVPHIGWNGIVPEKEHPLLRDIAPASDVYFVHSYYVACKNPADVLASTEYGTRFASMIAKDNVAGAQFHPEKSQAVGLGILRNFLEM